MTYTGLVYKKGKFSAIEEQQLKSAIERYQTVSILLMSSLKSMCESLFPGKKP